MKAHRFRAQGRVQGVGFRAFTARAGQQAGVRGWVKNDADGAVSGHVEGEDAAVDRFLDEVRKGPRAGRVDVLSLEEAAPGAFEGFEIRR